MKKPTEMFRKNGPPQFDPIPLVRPTGDIVTHRSLSMHAQQLLISNTDVAFVFSCDHSVELQLAVVRAWLLELRREAKERGDEMTAPKRLFDLTNMAATVAPALLAHQLSSDRGWGPTRIGCYMFPSMPIDKSKTKARDLAERGARYVLSGYLTFATRSALEVTPVPSPPLSATADAAVAGGRPGSPHGDRAIADAD
jgi:hypothetical protein